MNSDYNSKDSLIANPFFQCMLAHEFLHREDYDLQVKFFQLYHTQVEQTDKLLAIHYVISCLIDEVNALWNIIMDLKLKSETPINTCQN